jgi:hypothetical protein
MDVIDFAAMRDTNDLPVASPCASQTKSGRASFKNELTKRYGSKYRDPDNSEVLMGEQMPLWKARGIFAICMFGPNLPTEKHWHANLLQVWNMNSIKVVLDWRDQKALVIYLQGQLTTALVCVRTDLPNSASLFCQQTVFSGIRAPETQLHLGLGPTESSKYLRSECS